MHIQLRNYIYCSDSTYVKDILKKKETDFFFGMEKVW